MSDAFSIYLYFVAFEPGINSTESTGEGRCCRKTKASRRNVFKMSPRGVNISKCQTESTFHEYSKQVTTKTFPHCRLQLKQRLFWYRHHSEIHEMGLDRSSRAGNLTDFRKNSMRVFWGSKNAETNSKDVQINEI